VTRPEPANGDWSVYDGELQNIKNDNTPEVFSSEDKSDDVLEVAWQKTLATSKGLFISGFDGYI
jgi:hypothetical protein